MATAIIYDPDHRDHDPGADHPESPWRLDSTLEHFDGLSHKDFFIEALARSVDQTLIRRVHDDAYIDAVLSLAGHLAALDHETLLSPNSVAAALRAAGLAQRLVDLLIDRSADSVFALTRPPGHHAGRGAGAGYCIFNNMAVAVSHAQASGLHRVAIVDWDIHHGDGTEAIFRDNPGVLFVSLHAGRLFPPTTGDIIHGRPYQVNIPLNAGAGDADYLRIFEDIVLPRLVSHQPQLVLVSAGFDAHERDPMSTMRVTTQGFAAMTQRLCGLARDLDIGLGFLLEGGYDGAIVRDCVAAIVDVLASHPDEPIEVSGEPSSSTRKLIQLLESTNANIA